MAISKTKVYYLYYIEKQSLRTIGREFGVSASRIQQLMQKWDYSRRSGAKQKGQVRFRNLIEYLQHRRNSGQGTHNKGTFYRLAKPYIICCEKCGRTERLKISFLKREVLSLEDFSILCSYCLRAASVRGGVNGNEVREICDKYLAGKRVEELAENYGVAKITIYKILERNEKKRNNTKRKRGDKLWKLKKPVLKRLKNKFEYQEQERSS